MGKDAEPGYDNPWLDVVNHLIGLRLLQVIGWSGDDRTPRLCRVHRLIQQVTREQFSAGLSDIESRSAAVVGSLAESLSNGGWLDWNSRWEIPPLAAYAVQALDADSPNAAKFADHAAACLHNLGGYASAEPLCRRALEAFEHVLGPEHPDTLTSVNNLAGLLRKKGDHAAAEPLFRRALEASGACAGAGASGHADQREQPRQFAGEQGRLRRCRAAPSAGVGGTGACAGAGASGHADQREQPRQLAVEQGRLRRSRAALSAGVGSIRACAGTGASGHADQREQPRQLAVEKG